MGTKKKKKHSRGTARNGLRLSTVQKAPQRVGFACREGQDLEADLQEELHDHRGEEKGEAPPRRAFPCPGCPSDCATPRHMCARRVPDGSRPVWCGQRFATTDGPRRRADRAQKCGDGDRCTRLRARRERSLRSQAIRDELVEREKGEKQKAVAKDELHAKHGALSRFAK